MSLLQIATFLLGLGATARLTVLITADDIMAWAREAWRVLWIRALGPAHPWNRPRTGMMQSAPSCASCVSWWTGLLVFYTAWLSHGAGWFLYPAGALTASMATIVLMSPRGGNRG